MLQDAMLTIFCLSASALCAAAIRHYDVALMLPLLMFFHAADVLGPLCRRLLMAIIYAAAAMRDIDAIAGYTLRYATPRRRAPAAFDAYA